MSSDPNGIRLSLFLIVSGGSAVFSGMKRRRQQRAIEDTPCSEVRSAAQGLCEVQGYALPYRTESFASIDGDLAVYRDFHIEQQVREGKSTIWESVFSEKQGAQFVISDGTGLALVPVLGADFVVTETTRNWSKLDAETRARMLERYGGHVPELKFGPRGIFGLTSIFRFRESFLAVGAPVYARGEFSAAPGVNPALLAPAHYRFLGRLAELRKGPDWRRKAFDLDRDGRVGEEELRRGSRKILYQAKGTVTPEDRPEPVALNGVFTVGPAHGLIIGDGHQEHVAARLAKWNLLRIVGGAAAVAAGVMILAHRFG